MSDSEERPKRHRGADDANNREQARRTLQLLGSRQAEDDVQRALDDYTEDQWRNLVESLLQTHLDQSSTEAEVMIAFHLFYQLFCHRYKSEEEVTKRMKYVFQDANALEERKRKIMQVYGMLHLQLLSRRLIDEEDKTGLELYFKLKAIAFSIKTSFESMVTLYTIMYAGDPMMRAKLADLTPQLIFRELDPLKAKKHHQVLNFYFRKAFTLGLRKEGDRLYAPIFNSKGRHVCAFKYYGTISDFVFQAVYPLEHNEYLFACLIDNAQTPKNCIHFLKNFKNEYLPDLQREQSIFAFQNGLFLSKECRFYHFEKSEGEFWVGDLQENIVATTYHDMLYDEPGIRQDMRDRITAEIPYEHYMNVQMDEIYRFVRDQGFDTDEIRWIFCFLGRLLFRVGEFDSWGVFIYFIGLAGTGKGTLLRLVMSLMDKRDVGILNNELQKTFALDGQEDKRVLLGLDIDESFKLDKATLLSMSVGEEVSVIQKYKQANTVLWWSHIGFAGNTFPKWEDRGGNLARRFFLVECTKPVKNVDTSLFKKALAMKDRFLFVIVSAYMEIVHHYKAHGIKEFIPEKFKQAERKAMQELNALLSFVQERCDIEEVDNESDDRTLIQPFIPFNKAFGAYCKSNNIATKSLTANYMSGVFSRYQILVIAPGPNDKYGQTQKYLAGIQIKKEYINEM